MFQLPLGKIINHFFTSPWSRQKLGFMLYSLEQGFPNLVYVNPQGVREVIAGGSRDVSKQLQGSNTS